MARKSGQGPHFAPYCVHIMRAIYIVRLVLYPIIYIVRNKTDPSVADHYAYNISTDQHLPGSLAEKILQASPQSGSFACKFPRRSHNPIIKAAQLDKKATSISWLGNKRLQFEFH